MKYNIVITRKTWA